MSTLELPATEKSPTMRSRVTRVKSVLNRFSAYKAPPKIKYVKGTGGKLVPLFKRKSMNIINMRTVMKEYGLAGSINQEDPQNVPLPLISSTSLC